MKKSKFLLGILSAVGALVLSQCTRDMGGERTEANQSAGQSAGQYGGYESREKWGEHLVLTSACHDCHSPKVMTEKGMDIDFSKALSGHPSEEPLFKVDRKQMESSGLIVTQTLTSWAGPWGVSYAANLTPDSTGIGNWKESNFITAIRKGKYKGIESNRDLLPPMPWQMYQNMSDDELKAIFAYLKSIKPIRNVVPQPEPPVGAQAR